MKKIINIITTALITALVLVTFMGAVSVDAVAASKKKQQEAVSEEQKVLDQLIAYRDALVLAGVKGAELDNAEASIKAQQAVIAAKNSTAGSETMENTGSNNGTALNNNSSATIGDDTDAALKMYYAALEKQNAKKLEAEAKEKQKALEDAQKQMAEAQQAYVKAIAEGDKILNRGAKANPVGVIIIGDSRTNMMHEAVGDTGTTFIAENSKGYDWMIENALPRADKLITKGTKVVFTLGVNDTRNADKYIAKINQKTFEWTSKGAVVYFATVNPVWDNPYTSEAQVAEFNKKLLAGLQGVRIIDTNTYLKMSGYRMIDGLHFDTPTNAKVYLYIMGSL